MPVDPLDILLNKTPASADPLDALLAKSPVAQPRKFTLEHQAKVGVAPGSISPDIHTVAESLRVQKKIGPGPDMATALAQHPAAWTAHQIAWELQRQGLKWDEAGRYAAMADSARHQVGEQRLGPVSSVARDLYKFYSHPEQYQNAAPNNPALHQQLSMARAEFEARKHRTDPANLKRSVAAWQTLQNAGEPAFLPPSAIDALVKADPRNGAQIRQQNFQSAAAYLQRPDVMPETTQEGSPITSPANAARQGYLNDAQAVIESQRVFVPLPRLVQSLMPGVMPAPINPNMPKPLGPHLATMTPTQKQARIRLVQSGVQAQGQAEQGQVQAESATSGMSFAAGLGSAVPFVGSMVITPEMQQRFGLDPEIVSKASAPVELGLFALGGMTIGSEEGAAWLASKGVPKGSISTVQNLIASNTLPIANALGALAGGDSSKLAQLPKQLLMYNLIPPVLSAVERPAIQKIVAATLGRPLLGGLGTIGVKAGGAELANIAMGGNPNPLDPQSAMFIGLGIGGAPGEYAHGVEEHVNATATPDGGFPRARSLDGREGTIVFTHKGGTITFKPDDGQPSQVLRKNRWIPLDTGGQADVSQPILAPRAEEAAEAQAAGEPESVVPPIHPVGSHVVVNRLGDENDGKAGIVTHVDTEHGQAAVTFLDGTTAIHSTGNLEPYTPEAAPAKPTDMLDDAAANLPAGIGDHVTVTDGQHAGREGTVTGTVGERLKVTFTTPEGESETRHILPAQLHVIPQGGQGNAIEEGNLEANAPGEHQGINPVLPGEGDHRNLHAEEQGGGNQAGGGDSVQPAAQSEAEAAPGEGVDSFPAIVEAIRQRAALLKEQTSGTFVGSDEDDIAELLKLREQKTGKTTSPKPTPIVSVPAKNIAETGREEIPSKPATEGEKIHFVNLVDDSDDALNAAIKEYQHAQNGLSSNPVFNPALMKSGAKVGMILVQRGINDFATWSVKMKDTLSDAVEQYLEPLWAALKKWPEGKTFDDDYMTLLTKIAGRAYEGGAKDQAALEAVLKEKLPEIAYNDLQHYFAPVHAALERWPGIGRGIIDEGGQINDGNRSEETTNPLGIPGSQPLSTVSPSSHEGLEGEGGILPTDVPSTGGGEGQLLQPDGSGVQRPASNGGDTGEAVPSAGVNVQGGGYARADYTIRPEDAVGAGGREQKRRQNLDALRLLKQLDEEHRLATPAEQAVLVKYSGWGWSGNDLHNNHRYEPWYQELTALVNKDELNHIRESALNAHYTAPNVITGMWNAMKRLGFHGGNVLEPSAGIGHFFGLMPGDMRGNSTLAGVELDPVTGRILQQLYQKAYVQIDGFEKAHLGNDHYDLAISNVPFGNYDVYDPKFVSERGHPEWLKRIHNYFFVKSLQKVRPGGVIAFITSHGTLDANDMVANSIRQGINEQANFLGAIRLPNNAFEGNAGTSVTTDIIFLQKKGEGVHDSLTNPFQRVTSVPTAYGDTVMVNEYYAAHPEMVLGAHSTQGSMYTKNDYTVEPRGNLTDNIAAAVEHLPQDIYQQLTRPDTTPPPATGKLAPMNLPVGSFHIDKGVLYQVEKDTDGRNVLMQRHVTPETKTRIVSMVDMRANLDALREAEQSSTADDAQLTKQRKALKKAYEAFVEKHGPINDRQNKRLMADDSLHLRLAALEIYNSVKKKVVGYASILEKRSNWPHVVPDSAGTAKDALVISLTERGNANPELMARLTGRDFQDVAGELIREGLLYQEPSGAYVLPDEYASGNVRKKLADAQEAAHTDTHYQSNVDYLQQHQPRDLPPGEIKARLGANWVPIEHYQEFLTHLLDIPDYSPSLPRIKYNKATAVWYVDKYTSQDTNNRITWGTQRVPAAKIVEYALNSKLPTLSGPERDAKGNLVYNQKDTEDARTKVEEVQEEFSRWLWSDPQRSSTLADLYNRTVNVYRDRTFDGSHLVFPGKVDDSIIAMMAHQKDGAWRIIQSKNTMLAYEVGTGKTYTMITAAMEQRRMGLRHKILFAAKNGTEQQIADDWMKLYPGAKILVGNDEALGNPGKRNIFINRIANGDWDAVILPHTTFGLIPVHEDTIRAFHQEQIDTLRDYLDNVKKEDGQKSPRVKDIELIIKKLGTRLDTKLAELQKEKNKSINWEDLGVDQLYVDEAHDFRNLYVVSQLEGMSNAGNGKTLDMLMKVRHLQRMNNGGGVVFSTGTPIVNSLAEMHTMMRYLMPEYLEEQGMEHFDAWARSYTQQEQYLEENVSGVYRNKVRLAKFFNVPELMTLFRSVADIKRAEDMPQIIRPALVDEQGNVTGKPIIVKAEPNATQLTYFKDLVNRALHPGDDPHNIMLNISTDGRLSALDVRLRVPNAPDDPNSKVNNCINKVFEIWKDPKFTAQKRTQMIFLDQGVNPTPWGFSLYDDIINKLVAMGIPKDEIAIMPETSKSSERAALVSDMNDGVVRVVLGAREKMGVGINAQQRVLAGHNLDPTWHPASIEQGEGRIIRQGNDYGTDGVRIYDYVCVNTFDAFMWNKVYTKAGFISQVMMGKDGSREIDNDDGDPVFNLGELRAAASGNPLVQELLNAKESVRKLERQKSSHITQVATIWNQRRSMKSDTIPQAQKQIDILQGALEARGPLGEDVSPIMGMEKRSEGIAEIQKKFAPGVIAALDRFIVEASNHDEKKVVEPLKSPITWGQRKEEAQTARTHLAALFPDGIPDTNYEWQSLGNYRGFDLQAKANSDGNVAFELKKGDYSRENVRNATNFATSTQIQGVFRSIDDNLNRLEDQIAGYQQDIAHAESEMEKLAEQARLPFRYEDNLQAAHAKLRELEVQAGDLLKSDQQGWGSQFTAPVDTSGIFDDDNWIDSGSVMDANGPGVSGMPSFQKAMGKGSPSLPPTPPVTTTHTPEPPPPQREEPTITEEPAPTLLHTAQTPSTMGETISAAASAAGNSLKGTVTALQTLAAADNVTLESRQMGVDLVSLTGRVAHLGERMSNVLTPLLIKIERLPFAQRVDLVDRFEQGFLQGTELGKTFEQAMKRLEPEYREIEDDLNVRAGRAPAKRLERWFPHYWKEPKGAQDILSALGISLREMDTPTKQLYKGIVDKFNDIHSADVQRFVAGDDNVMHDVVTKIRQLGQALNREHLLEDIRANLGESMAREENQRPDHQKPRLHPTRADGTAAGLHLSHLNPIDDLIRYYIERQSNIENLSVFVAAKEAGVAEYYSNSDVDNIPRDYRRISRPGGWDVYLPKKTTAWESFDEGVMTKLRNFAESLSIDITDQIGPIHQNQQIAGMSEPGKGITRRVGSADSTLMHEIGHQLADRYPLFKAIFQASGVRGGSTGLPSDVMRIWRRVFKNVQDALPGLPVETDKVMRTVRAEMKSLANLRLAEGETSQSRFAYVQNRVEKPPVALEAYLHAPDLMARVAPVTYEIMHAYLNEVPELRPLDQISPTLRSAVHAVTEYTGGFEQVGGYYVPKDVEAVINARYGKGIRNADNPIIRTTFRGIQYAKANLLHLKFAIPLFHGKNILIQTMDAKLAKAIREISTGQFGEAGKDILISATPLAAPGTALHRGIMMRDLYYADPKTLTPDQQEIVTAYVNAGMRMALPEELQTHARVKFVRAYYDMLSVMNGGKPLEAIGKGAKLLNPLQAVGTLIDVMKYPIMDFAVPVMKAGTFVDGYHLLKEELTHAGHLDTLVARSQELARDIDYRFGELTYENYFSDPVLKDLGFLMVQAPGWTGGTVMSYAKGVSDIATTPWRMAKGGPAVTESTALALATVINTAVLGSIACYLYSGRKPKELKDIIFYPTGKMNADGSEQRMQPFGYGGELYNWEHAPIQTAQHKMSPVFGEVAQIWNNRNYYGQQYYDPNAATKDQLVQFLLQASKDAMPIALQSGQKLIQNGWDVKGVMAQTLMGQGMAPGSVNDTPAMDELRAIQHLHGSGYTIAYDDIAQTEAERALIAKINLLPEQEGHALLRDAVQHGMKPQRATAIANMRGESPLARGLKPRTWEEALKIYSKMSDQEKMLPIYTAGQRMPLIIAILVKISNANDKLPNGHGADAQRQEIKAAFQRISQDPVIAMLRQPAAPSQ